MTPEEHRAKAEKIERSLAKCGPADCEMKIEGAMLAGTHWVNLVLHRMGVTPPQGDVLHTYMLTVNELRRLRVADPEMLDALSESNVNLEVVVRSNDSVIVCIYVLTVFGGEYLPQAKVVFLLRLSMLFQPHQTVFSYEFQGF